MTDRLTQLQICLDQLVEQFCATLNYIDKNHGFEPLNTSEPLMSDKHATVAPPDEFSNTIDELSTDIILKTRQTMKLIDSLPGVDVSAEEQLHKIDSLQKKLVQVEEAKIQAIKEKENLLTQVDGLIDYFVTGIASTRHNNVGEVADSMTTPATTTTGTANTEMNTEVNTTDISINNATLPTNQNNVENTIQRLNTTEINVEK
ncbi:Srb7p NDAI_0C04220 [Naumovozyma dairenensis CBS 421]|uniref:Mediator of RNA polymerase II transcription subunit 21 n=1 Tax=Naumovozyma dairenensis (strain ATCC 10597 / BCRC 20456 / CBS 421 / NBRC 0211 / NRRL Y-12639) TaxID=1071378 RepID=G0W8H1_NAUDC|nr:hypothetical protein NDAI_0C04220 [Naumovozyma dairenensis CBS 421]CCD24082.1 hypothetical protein NDAI_0C04220 [Naumovozyma dairenensis CBS 421]